MSPDFWLGALAGLMVGAPIGLVLLAMLRMGDD